MKDSNREKLGLLSELIKMAQADNELREVEFTFLLSLATQMGVTRDDFKALFEEYIEFAPPKLEADRIVQFHRLVLLMNVDTETAVEEIEYIRQAGIRMGLNPLATNEILRIMNDYPNKIVPTQKLIEVFRRHHN